MEDILLILINQFKKFFLHNLNKNKKKKLDFIKATPQNFIELLSSRNWYKNPHKSYQIGNLKLQFNKLLWRFINTKLKIYFLKATIALTTYLACCNNKVINFKRW